jgi:hypothetical protein
MAKKTIKLTESDLHRMVSESVDRILNEIKIVGKIDDFQPNQTYSDKYSPIADSEKVINPQGDNNYSPQSPKSAAMLYKVSNGKSANAYFWLYDYGIKNGVSQDGLSDEEYVKKVVRLILK